MLNSLANHGYIPRDGRNVKARNITTGLHDVVGVSFFVSAIFAHPIFFTPKPAPQQPLTSIWTAAWYYLRHPLALLCRFGMRRPNQVDPVTKKHCLDLDQLGFPGAIEHDISLIRRDRAQGDCCTPQSDLITELLASSSDGGNTLTIADFVAFRKRRIEQQREENPRAMYGAKEHSFACMEIALLLGVFGEGSGNEKKIRCDFARAFLQEERLPIQEGWVRRSWWRRLGLLELGLTAGRMKRLVGLKV